MSGVERGRPGLRQYFVGVDLGQAADPTAIAVVERAELVGEWDAVAWAYRREIELRLRGLDRLPLDTKYPEVEEWVRAIVDGMSQQGECEVLVDATGVGRPVVDHLRVGRLGGRLRAVLVTGGQAERSDGGFDYVPKRDLMAGLQVLIEYGELKIAKSMNNVEALRKEMADMRVKVTPSGNEQFGTWRQGEHDDMVFAVALACWGAKKRYPHKPTGVGAYWIGRPLR